MVRIVYEVTYRNGEEVSRRVKSRQVIGGPYCAGDPPAESGAPGVERTKNTCEVMLDNFSFRFIGEDAYRRAARSGTGLSRVEQGAWLIPTRNGQFVGKYVRPQRGSNDVRLVPDEPPTGATWLIHSHLYRAAPGIIGGQRLSPSDTAFAENTGMGMASFGPDSVYTYLPGGTVQGCRR